MDGEFWKKRINHELFQSSASTGSGSSSPSSREQHQPSSSPSLPLVTRHHQRVERHHSHRETSSALNVLSEAAAAILETKPPGYRSLPPSHPMETSPVPGFNATSSQLNFNRRDRSTSSLTYRGSPYELSLLHKEHLQSTRRNSDPSDRAVIAAIMAHRQATAELQYHHPLPPPPDDEPLDMSLKSRNSSGSESHSRSDRSDSGGSDVGMGAQMRPSVITCAPSLMRSKHSVSPNCHQSTRGGISHSAIQPKGYSPKNYSDERRSAAGQFEARSYLVYDEPSPQMNKGMMDGQISERTSKTKILSGVAGNVDPVIDEHFRRSLGKDYTEILSKNQSSGSTGIIKSNTAPAPLVSTCISSTVSDVDDHFAKALGASMWMKLKKSDLNTNSSDSVLTKDSPNNNGSDGSKDCNADIKTADGISESSTDHTMDHDDEDHENKSENDRVEDEEMIVDSIPEGKSSSPDAVSSSVTSAARQESIPIQEEVSS